MISYSGWPLNGMVRVVPAGGSLGFHGIKPERTDFSTMHVDLRNLPCVLNLLRTLYKRICTCDATNQLATHLIYTKRAQRLHATYGFETLILGQVGA